MPLEFRPFTEGMIWVAGAHNPVATTSMVSLYDMFVAWIGWPVWISVYFTEPPRRHAREPC